MSVTYNLELRKALNRLLDGLAGGFTLKPYPTTLGSSKAAITTAIAGSGFSRKVRLSLADSNGEVVDLSRYTFVVGVSTNSAGGSVSIGGVTSLKFIDGVADIDIVYTGVWLATETVTFTVTGGTKNGVVIANVTSIDTLVA